MSNVIKSIRETWRDFKTYKRKRHMQELETQIRQEYASAFYCTWEHGFMSAKREADPVAAWMNVAETLRVSHPVSDRLRRMYGKKEE